MIYRFSGNSCLFLMSHKWCHLCASMHVKYVWEIEGCSSCGYFFEGRRGERGGRGGVVSLYIALLSCARGSRKVEERITAFYRVGNKEHVSSN